MNHTNDEFEELSARLNQVLEKIDALVGGMRGALDGVAHDLRMPIARLRGVAEMALTSDPNLDSYREALSDCLEESEGILAMLNTLMDISPTSGEFLRPESHTAGTLERARFGNKRSISSTRAVCWVGAGLAVGFNWLW